MNQPINEIYAGLCKLSAPELRQKYRDAFGEETRSRNKVFISRRIAWRLQEQSIGGLSDRAKAQARELANESDLRMRAPRSVFPNTDAAPAGLEVKQAYYAGQDHRLPMPGAVLVRPYQGGVVRVTILEKGFEYKGQVFRSLTAVAKEITGSHWNGFNFFGLDGKERKSS